MSSNKREQYTELINSLEKALFLDPFHGDVEDPETFTPEGRKRVEAWIERHFGDVLRCPHLKTFRARPAAVPPASSLQEFADRLGKCDRCSG